MPSTQSDGLSQTDDIRIMAVGTAGVGKSSLIKRFLKESLSKDYEPTKSDLYMRNVTVEGVEYPVEVYDTAGFHSMTSHRDALYRAVEGFVLVFDLTDSDSFKTLEFLRQRILLSRPDARLVVVGNKMDLSGEREVKEQDGQQQGLQWQCPYFESSALYDLNVENVFGELLRLVVKERRVRRNEKRGKSCVIT